MSYRLTFNSMSRFVYISSSWVPVVRTLMPFLHENDLLMLDLLNKMKEWKRIG